MLEILNSEKCLLSESVGICTSEDVIPLQSIEGKSVPNNDYVGVH